MPRKSAAEKQAETRARLIEAAVATFLECGYHAASLDEISDRAGYSRGAIYSNFDNKEVLFLACFHDLSEGQLRIWDEFIANVREIGTEPDSFGKVLDSVLPDRRWNRASVEFRMTDISERSRQELGEVQARWQGVVAKLLELYCATNGLTPATSVETLAEMVGALLDGLRFRALTNPDIDFAGYFMTTLNLLLTGRPTLTSDER